MNVIGKDTTVHMSNFQTSRKLAMLLGDIVLIGIAYILSVSFVMHYRIGVENIFIYNGLFPIMICVTGMMFNINELYTILTKGFSEVFIGVLAANICALVLIMAFSFLIKDYTYSRWVLLVAFVFQTIFLEIWRYMLWQMGRSMIGTKEVILLSSVLEYNRVKHRLRLYSQMNINLKEVYTDLANDLWKHKVLTVDCILLGAEIDYTTKVNIINFCYKHGIQVVLLPDISAIFAMEAQLDKIDDVPVLRLNNLRPSLEVRVLKRILDILFSFIGFIIVLPCLLVSALAIKISDGGPILYSQVRIGLDGKEFKIYKLRTMRVDAEKFSGPMLAQEHDPRITKLGSFLRAVRLDEIPQIWNVLIGDMSIVGPRPERPFFVRGFLEEMSEYAYRHNVKPGITGMAQVYGKYNTTAYDKLVYDLMYIQKCNLFTDLVIIIQTVKVLFSKSATEGFGKITR